MNEVWRARSGMSRVGARVVESGPEGENLADDAWRRLEALPDPRSPQGRIYPLPCLIAIAVCAFTAAGTDRLTAVGQWAKRASQADLARLAAPWNPVAGQYRAPDEKTIRMVLDRLDPRALTSALLGPRRHRRGRPGRLSPADVRGYRARRTAQEAKTLARGRLRAVRWTARPPAGPAAATEPGCISSAPRSTADASWTTSRSLAEWADTVTAIDAAPEAVAIARDRVRSANVSFEVADVFSWNPGTRFDVIFFSAWLSHVPASRFGQFWQLLGNLLVGNGRVLLIDEHIDERGKEAYVAGRDEVIERRLRDGSTFRVIKNFVDPQELELRLRRLGWDCTIRRDGSDWVYGEARLAR